MSAMSRQILSPRDEINTLYETIKTLTAKLERALKDLKINEDLNSVQNAALIRETHLRESAEQKLREVEAKLERHVEAVKAVRHWGQIDHRRDVKEGIEELLTDFDVIPFTSPPTQQEPPKAETE